jgi:hypothetical protein
MGPDRPHDEVRRDLLECSTQRCSTGVAQFVGEVYGRRGRNMLPATRVEAFVGNARCGIASIRRTGSFWGYTIAVAGPNSIVGCERGAPLTFRINGRPWTPSSTRTRGTIRST